MKKKKLILIVPILLLISTLTFIERQTASASCPSNTQVGDTWATLVGEVTDDGGDPNLTVWFQYGLTSSYGYETNHLYTIGTGLFCSTVYGLNSCTTYHFRAVAKNSGGTSYGEDQALTTLCPVVTVDLKANGSGDPISLYYRDYVNLSWTSQNAVSCQASGDWSGSKQTSGTESIQLNYVKTYTFTLTCYSSSGQSASDSVTINVHPRPPQVITKPAVVTR